MKVKLKHREVKWTDVVKEYDIPEENKYYFSQRVAYAVIIGKSWNEEEPTFGTINIISIDCDSFSDNEMKMKSIPIYQLINELKNDSHTWYIDPLKWFITKEGGDERTEEQFKEDFKTTIKQYKTMFDLRLPSK